MKRILSQFAPLFGLVFVFLLFVVLSPSSFSSFDNIRTILTQTVIVGIAALGMTFVIISGGIDLSVGSQIALGTVVVAVVLKAFLPADISDAAAMQVTGGQTLIAALAAIAVCAVCGLVAGSLTSYLKIVPFIITLGTMLIARGSAKWLANEQTITTPQNGMQNLTQVFPEPAWLVFAPGVWAMVLLFIVTHVVLKYTVFGRYVFAIGSNEKTARLCGINVPVYRTAIYALNSVFVGVASIMQYSNLQVGDPTAAVGMELDIIAAVVIGGGSLSGGEGSAAGTIIGALLIAVLRNGCQQLGVPNFVQEIIIGIIIIGAVGVDKLKPRLA